MMVSKFLISCKIASNMFISSQFVLLNVLVDYFIIKHTDMQMVFALLDWKNAVKQRIWKNCKMDRREMSIFVRCTRTIILPVTQWIIG